LRLQGQEGVNIANSFKNKDFSAFMTGGMSVEGYYYIFLREDGNVVYARSHGCVTAHASKTAIIIAHCPTDCQHGIMNNAVAKLVEHLESHDM
jgi:profilin